MQYALLYYYDPDRTGPTEGEVAEWIAFDEEVKADGVFIYEAGLQSHQSASIVQTRNGTTTVEPSPVAATGEVIAGFYILDVSSPDEAANWAKRVPTAKYGKVEMRPVRPVVEFKGQ